MPRLASRLQGPSLRWKDTHHPSHQTRTGRAVALKEEAPPAAPFRSISSERVPDRQLASRPRRCHLVQDLPPPRDQGGAGAAESAAALATSPRGPAPFEKPLGLKQRRWAGSGVLNSSARWRYRHFSAVQAATYLEEFPSTPFHSYLLHAAF